MIQVLLGIVALHAPSTAEACASGVCIVPIEVTVKVAEAAVKSAANLRPGKLIDRAKPARKTVKAVAKVGKAAIRILRFRK